MFAVLGRLTLLLLSHLLLTLLGEALSRLLCLLPGALLVGLSLGAFCGAAGVA
jgi:hypothetical protein